MHAFAPGDSAEVLIRLRQRPGELVVTIEDAGTPVAPADTAAGAKGWVAQLVSRGFADRLHASF